MEHIPWLGKKWGITHKLNPSSCHNEYRATSNHKIGILYKSRTKSSLVAWDGSFGLCDHKQQACGYYLCDLNNHESGFLRRGNNDLAHCKQHYVLKGRSLESSCQKNQRAYNSLDSPSYDRLRIVTLQHIYQFAEATKVFFAQLFVSRIRVSV